MIALLIARTGAEEGVSNGVGGLAFGLVDDLCVDAERETRVAVAESGLSGADFVLRTWMLMLCLLRCPNEQDLLIAALAASAYARPVTLNCGQGAFGVLDHNVAAVLVETVGQHV